MYKRLCHVSGQWWSDLPELTKLEKHVQQSDETWSDMLNWLSRFKTELEKLTLAPSNCNSLTNSLFNFCLFSSHSNWVLSAFILSRLLLIHASIRCSSTKRRPTVVDADVAGALMYTCVSSVYDCAVKPTLAITLKNSAVYKRNSNWRKCIPFPEKKKKRNSVYAPVLGTLVETIAKWKSAIPATYDILYLYYCSRLRSRSLP